MAVVGCQGDIQPIQPTRPTNSSFLLVAVTAVCQYMIKVNQDQNTNPILERRQSLPLETPETVAVGSLTNQRMNYSTV